MKLILLGPPGAGKGTQCKRISDKYEIAHLSSGDILRAERAAGTELGQKAQDYMDTGRLVPDDVIIDMMIDAIKKSAGGYVLDGFPRTAVQAEELDKALFEAAEEITGIINLQVSDGRILSRLTGRRSCPQCGAVYHIENLKPRMEGICDRDGQKLVQRTDDTPEVVADRLKAYHEQTSAVVGYYRRRDKTVIDIDAAGGIDDVTASIFSNLDVLCNRIG
ncbi:MAG TPA: adenylate kinase [Planctomycetes bacterium]|nr:adenylate kinase [Planctomycetota bacterium]HIJ71019.1 adenylate kinase [Planctomycetota bacterium]